MTEVIISEEVCGLPSNVGGTTPKLGIGQVKSNPSPVPVSIAEAEVGFPDPIGAALIGLTGAEGAIALPSFARLRDGAALSKDMFPPLHSIVNQLNDT